MPPRIPGVMSSRFLLRFDLIQQPQRGVQQPALSGQLVQHHPHDAHLRVPGQAGVTPSWPVQSGP